MPFPIAKAIADDLSLVPDLVATAQKAFGECELGRAKLLERCIDLGVPLSAMPADAVEKHQALSVVARELFRRLDCLPVLRRMPEKISWNIMKYEGAGYLFAEEIDHLIDHSHLSESDLAIAFGDTNRKKLSEFDALAGLFARKEEEAVSKAEYDNHIRRLVCRGAFLVAIAVTLFLLAVLFVTQAPTDGAIIWQSDYADISWPKEKIYAFWISLHFRTWAASVLVLMSSTLVSFVLVFLHQSWRKLSGLWNRLLSALFVWNFLASCSLAAWLMREMFWPRSLGSLLTLCVAVTAYWILMTVLFLLIELWIWIKPRRVFGRAVVLDRDKPVLTATPQFNFSRQNLAFDLALLRKATIACIAIAAISVATSGISILWPKGTPDDSLFDEVKARATTYSNSISDVITLDDTNVVARLQSFLTHDAKAQLLICGTYPVDDINDTDQRIKGALVANTAANYLAEQLQRGAAPVSSNRIHVGEAIIESTKNYDRLFSSPPSRFILLRTWDSNKNRCQ
jgi:hypothetical protein